MSSLFIIESPGKIKKIKSILGDGYAVIASYGHIRELPRNGLGIDVENGFKPEYQISEDKKKVVEQILFMSDKVDDIYLATDMDREGEAIAYSVYECIPDECRKKCKRIIYSEITKKAIQSAIKKGGEIDFKKVDSQIARQILDRLIGFTVSPMMWNRVLGGKSAGRVQSIALRLIAERELEINKFVSNKFWDISVDFNIAGEFVSGMVKTKEKGNKILDEKKVKIACDKMSNATALVKSVSVKDNKRGPYPPFDTASLEKTGSSMFGYSSHDIMEVAQTLYEQGAITYHRTDSFSVSDDAFQMCKEWLINNLGEKYLSSTRRVYEKNNANAQEAHECIRPTFLNINKDIEDEWSTKEKNIFNLIRSRFIASQMQDVVYGKTDIEVSMPPCIVLITGKVLRFDGWTKIYKTNVKETVIPIVKKGDLLKIKEIIPKEHETRPPDRYNEGSLIEKMEKEGVGRPSTWSSIIKNIIDRGYVLKDKRNFVLTKSGLAVYEFLMGKFESFFMDIKFTSKVERELDKICSGELNRQNVIKEFYETLDSIINKEKYEMWNDLFD